MKALVSAALLLGSMLVSAPAVMAQAPPPTLTGETLNSSGTATMTTSASCNPDGTSTFTYQTSGIATGPYAGTYTETGTVTLGPQPIKPGVFSAPGGIVTSWTAGFTITSTAPIVATITGSKTLLPPPPGLSPDVVGICEDGTRGIPGFPPFPSQQAANNFFGNQLLGYTATITLSGGEQFRDTGTSRASESVIADAPSATFFIENYVSQQTVTIPLCDENSQGDQIQDDDDQGCVNP